MSTDKTKTELRFKQSDLEKMKAGVDEKLLLTDRVNVNITPLNLAVPGDLEQIREYFAKYGHPVELMTVLKVNPDPFYNSRVEYYSFLIGRKNA